MALLDHPKNVQDLSAEKGFQWKFDCDICGSGFTTSFIPSKSETKAKRLGFLGRGLEVAGGFTGKSGLYSAGQAAAAAGQYQSMSAAWHTEHDGAFGQAINETTTHFKKCPKCKLYVCTEDWNGEAGLCTNDAPSLVTEMQATKAQVRVEQMREHVKAQTLYDGDTQDRATVCPTCGKPAGAGKFCQNCGASLAFQECANCHHKNPMGVPFCGECGTKL